MLKGDPGAFGWEGWCLTANPEDSSPHLSFSKTVSEDIKKNGKTVDFAGSHFEKNLGKKPLSFVSGVVGYASLLISASFVYGSQRIFELGEKKDPFCTLPRLPLARKSVIPLRVSPLKLSKNERAYFGYG